MAANRARDALAGGRLKGLDGKELETTLEALLPHAFRAEKGVFEPPQAKSKKAGRR